MPVLELSSVSALCTEAGALAAPVAGAATEFQTTEMGHSLVEILPFCSDMLGSAVADATRRSTESSESYRQLCHAAMLWLRAFGLGHSMAKATAHAEGQRSPAQVAAEEKGQAGNREGTSQRPLMMRRGAMLAGSGCG